VGGARRHLAGFAATTAAVVAVAAAAVFAVQATRDFDARADANDALDYADREIAWGNGWTLSQPALYAARSLIPPRAPYAVRVGATERFDDSFTPTFVASYLRAFLVPRPQREDARWVVCYRCDPPAAMSVVWADEDAGVSILRRREA
jgi:hypothetical protein